MVGHDAQFGNHCTDLRVPWWHHNHQISEKVLTPNCAELGSQLHNHVAEKNHFLKFTNKVAGGWNPGYSKTENGKELACNVWGHPHEMLHSSVVVFLLWRLIDTILVFVIRYSGWQLIWTAWFTFLIINFGWFFQGCKYRTLILRVSCSEVMPLPIICSSVFSYSPLDLPSLKATVLHFSILPFWEACFSVFPWYSNPTADCKGKNTAGLNDTAMIVRSVFK